MRKPANWFSKNIIQLQILASSFHKRNWVSYNARKLIKDSQLKERRSIFIEISESWFAWMHPQKWNISFSIAFILVVLPQIILSSLPVPSFEFLDIDFISTIWQILASVIGISFVIVVFLTEYSQDQTYERRAFPIYISSTSMIFSIMMGMMTLMSMGINYIFSKSPKIDSHITNSMGIWNTILFFINILIVINLYIKTYQLLNPSYFRKILLRYHRKKVLERVYQELFKRVKRNLTFNYLQKIGIEAAFFGYDADNMTVIKTERLFTGQQVIDDVNFDLLKKARLLDNKKIIFRGMPGTNISKDYSEIAYITQGINNEKTIQFLRHAVKVIPWQNTKLASAEEDLLINRDLVSVAITSGQANNVEVALSLYIETIEAFLESLKQFGHRFTPESA